MPVNLQFAHRLRKWRNSSLGWGMHFGRCIGARFTPQDAVDLIDKLLHDSRGVNWKQVAVDCWNLARNWDGLWDIEAEVVDHAGQSWDMRSYATYARGRAEERLSPDDLRDLLRQREDEQAEERLKTYFFPDVLWTALPQRAQQALVDADRAWFSTQRGRIESVLEHLKVATEALCFEVIWKSLQGAQGGPDLLGFKKRDLELADSGHNPSLVDYARFCGIPSLRALVLSWGGKPGDIEFLSKKLAKHLQQLTQERNAAEHDPKVRWDRRRIRDLFDLFLGVRAEGVLPRLALLADIKRQVDKVSAAAPVRSPTSIHEWSRRNGRRPPGGERPPFA